MSFGANAKTFEMKEVGWDVNVEQAGSRDLVPRPLICGVLLTDVEIPETQLTTI